MGLRLGSLGDGMEVSQFTYFQQVGGHDCNPISGELTYGLERLAMYILGIDYVMDMPFNDPKASIPLKYGDILSKPKKNIPDGILMLPIPKLFSGILMRLSRVV